MLRRIYIRLLWWHPARFRSRFGDEMLADFDNASDERDQRSLIADGVVSLFRQWIWRPHHAPVQAAAPSKHVLFQTIEDHKLAPTTILNASVLSTALLCTAIFAIGRGGANRPLFIMGAIHPRPGLLSFDRASLAASELDTQIRFPAERQDPWRAVAVLYFKNVIVLRALDRDSDYNISSRELAAATQALRSLDADRDGTLTPEECGHGIGPEAHAQLAPDIIRRARLHFMHANPVLAALDGDGDGTLSAPEIRSARASLLALDRNADRTLSPNEVIPDLVATQVSMVLARLDKDGDNKLSMGERLDSEADPLRKIIETADRNRDNTVTRQELTDRLQLSQEVKNRLDQAVRSRP